MNRRPRTRDQREAQANRVVAYSVAGLLTVAVIAIAVMALQPAPRPATSVPSPATTTTTTATATATATAKEFVPSKPPELKPLATKPPAPKPRPKTTVPDQMKRLLPGSSQIIVVTGAELGSKSGTLSLYDLKGGGWSKVLSTPANFGATGLTNGETREQGYLNTPTGIWSIGFLFGQHGSAPSGTRMPYRHITDDSWWSAERDSTYNTWVESGSHVSGEHLADAQVQYEYAFNSGYNAPPNERVVGRGTAIFIHCFEPPGNSLGKYTHGCVAISRTDMVKLFRLLDPKKHPSCVIGTEVRGTSTSIYAY